MFRQCPDCELTLTKATPLTAMQGERVRLRTEDPRSGFLGRLGAKERVNVTGYVCPECGLVRWYVDEFTDEATSLSR
ncbi:hypothetical protein [Natronocalculus amylovorans]|uniref:Uncharacterized protein n=1 Tax=Natronocalculus amylovorans TaxID=2917812 RepID=A0AAE3FZC5_9EURY|nr:hypothetical protein [Natronocalculus amylovorans]MCL9817965.1 hypothetical protein [Natronocalculus amylovorans]NUE03101.1 hypothetical protein [Halorubraceae archaeon YAN]